MESRQLDIPRTSLNVAIMHVQVRILNAFSRQFAEYNEVLVSVEEGEGVD
jgi:hypothetical protein